MGDFELLRAYVEPGTEAAFTELVNRHINLVHSAALRQVADPQTAAEISQTVFIILARKARTIQPGTVLAGWLLLTTRYTAANARRRDQHRHVTEQQAMDHLYMSYTDAAWKQIAPLLDEALVALRESDRDAVALRFFEERSFKEIGAALSISEDSARKRVSRALKRLRSLLARRGCVVPVAVVTLAISGRVAKAAPAALGETVAAAVLKETVTVASLPFLVQATLQTLNWIRWRSIAFRTATVAFTVGLAVFLSGIVSTKGGAQPNRTQVHAQLSVPQPATANPAASEEGAALAQVPPQPNGPGLLFRVVDAESQSPLEKVRLTLTWITEFPDRRTNTYATDGNGECVFPIDRTPVKNWNSRIEVFKDGYVPKFVSWSASQGDTIDAIPAQYTARLTRGTEIGGLVVNEEGDPVPDVRVVFNVSGPSPGASHDRERLTMMGNYHAEVTDVQGRWRCDHVPQQFGMITFECFHPLYLTARFGATALGATTALGMNYVAEAELRNGTARTTLKTGPLVAGTVVDEAGKPIPHAKVTENRAWHEASASEETGSGGRFRFANNSQQDLVLTVQAKAFAPLDLTIHPGEQTGALTLALSKGGLLRGKIVDGFGQPVPDAKIRVGNAKSGDRRFEWSARSDAQGTFEWASAPHQTSYEVEASGYQSQSNVELTPDGSEHAITLLSAQQGKTFHISGTAVDSETGKPIETFHVLTVTTEGERTPSGTKATSISSPELQVIGTAGKFSFDGHRSILHYIVELQAVGYCPARMELDGPLTNDAQLAFELKHATQVTGVVQLPDGRAAIGAVVMLSAEDAHQDSRFPTRMQTVYMKLPGEFDLLRSQASRTSTDSEGRFSFEPKLAMKRILIAHKSGYADVPLEQLTVSPVVMLQPWGRVVGTLRIGSRAGTNETLYLRDWGWAYLFTPSLQINLEVHTDSEGHFTIEGVPPGEWQISHEVRLRSASPGADELKPVKIEIGRGTSMILPPRSGPGVSRFIHVEPGQTAQVNLGGTGRKLVGKVNAAGINQAIDWQRDVHRLTSKASRPQVGPTPKRDDLTSDQEYGAAQQQWYARAREFWLSDAGAKAKLVASDYVLVFDSAGSFHIDDVLPGDYELNMRVSDPTVPDSFFRGHSLGTLTKQISVPETSDASVSDPLDLGVFNLTAGGNQ